MKNFVKQCLIFYVYTTMDILEAFLKKIKNEISKEKQKLKKVEDEIFSLAQEKNKLEKEYSFLENAIFSDPLSLQMKTGRMLSIIQSIKSIEKDIRLKEEEAEKLRIKIKEKNAEKKAIEKYKETLKKEKNVEEIKRETQLIDEIFNRNNH